MSLPDELINEVDVVMTRMGRMMVSRHAEDLGGPINAAFALVLHALEQRGQLKVSDISALLAIKAPATTAIVDSLEAHGYVERVADESDRRVTLVRPLPAGLTALAEGECCRREGMRRYLSVLTEDDVRALIRILRTLMDAMDEGRV